MDQQNKTDNEIMNIPAEETPEKPVSEKDEEFAQAVAKANEILGDDEDEAPTEHVPTAFEKKMAAIPEDKWNLYQIIAGIVIGLFTVYALYGGEDTSYMFLTAILIALVGPNQFEKAANRKIYKGRVAMCISLAVGIAVMFVVYLVTGKLSNPPA